MMFSILKPFLFKLDPEIAHDLAIKSLKFNYLPKQIFQVEGEEILNIKLFGINFPNPIGLAAGFDKSAEVYNSLLRLGFGFVEVGTVTLNPQYGTPYPRLFRLQEDQAIINRMGFNNEGAFKMVERFLEKLTQQYARLTVHEAIKEQGFQFQEEWEMDDNTIEITATRWIQ